MHNYPCRRYIPVDTPAHFTCKCKTLVASFKLVVDKKCARTTIIHTSVLQVCLAMASDENPLLACARCFITSNGTLTKQLVYNERAFKIKLSIFSHLSNEQSSNEDRSIYNSQYEVYILYLRSGVVNTKVHKCLKSR